MQEDLLALEREFAQAIVKSDVDAVEQFLADDWMIIDPDGGMIEKSHFLDAMKSGALTHDTMESVDVRVRIYETMAVVTALTTTKGSFSGHAFASTERATDVFVHRNGRWQCVLTQLTRFTKK